MNKIIRDERLCDAVLDINLEFEKIRTEFKKINKKIKKLEKSE